VFIVFLYFVFFLLCFYLWNNTESETVILLHWPHVSDCILCWPFGQYSPVMTYVMLVIVCWLINLLINYIFYYNPSWTCAPRRYSDGTRLCVSCIHRSI